MSSSFPKNCQDLILLQKKKRSRPFSCWNRCPRAILVTAVTSGLRRSRAIFLGSIASISWGPLGVGEELTRPETSAGVGWTVVWKGRCCPLPGAHLAIKILCNNGRGSLWTQATQLLSSKPLNTYFSFCSPPSLSLVPRGCRFLISVLPRAWRLEEEIHTAL